jgi:hypothetical protein
MIYRLNRIYHKLIAFFRVRGLCVLGGRNDGRAAVTRNRGLRPFLFPEQSMEYSKNRNDLKKLQRRKRNGLYV